jgi:hypothetical protein
MEMIRKPLLVLAILAAATGARAQEESGGDLRSAVQNPIGSLISVPFKFSFDNGAPNGKANSLTVQPVFPVALGEEWTLINRFIVPLWDAPGGVGGLANNPGGGVPSTSGRQTGLGDINYSGFISPAQPSGAIWGLGASITAPSATNDSLGTGKWSAGPTGIILFQPEWGTIGGLARHLWSFAGSDSRQDVNQTLIEPFINYNLDNGWYLVSDMVITADWEAASGQKLTVPIGGGVGKLLKVGQQAMNIRGEAYYNVERPDNAPEWSIGFTVQLLFPK